MWVTLHYLFMGPGLIQPAATTHTQPRSGTVCLVELSTGLLKFQSARPTFMNTIHNMLKGPFTIVSLTPEGTFNKVKALVGAFSGHHEIRKGSLTALV